MKRRHTVLAALATAALALPLTACGGNGGAATGDGAADSPLTAYLSAAWGGDLSPEDQQQRFAEQQKKAEELQAACMSAQGFEYIPVDSSAMMAASDGSEWKPEDREWVSQYGYGMVDWPGRDELNGAGTEVTDPNQEYVLSLSESEQAAYYEALYGAGPTDDQLAEDGSYEWNWETAGCSGQAQHEVSGADPWNADEFSTLIDAINELYSTLATNPALAAVDAEWSACMADAGQPGFATQPDAAASISDDLQAYYEKQTEQVSSDPALVELGQREIDLALIDLDCREKTDYRSKQQKATFALEEQFVTDHKAELEAFKAAAEAGR